MARQHESMAGLDVTAKWELLTWCDNLVPEPENSDANLHPPTEMNAALNPKYGFVEMFYCIPFGGTMEKMQCCRPEGQSVHLLRGEKRKQRTDSRHSRPTMLVTTRKFGGQHRLLALVWLG